ncbi:hypothetical protein Pcinc_014172 [Petrolisthes cinctipes]|uniref:Uncharacterized protein n=1 Tax=Petrolisthes cinctipes TaxID=88211 RepID=A0AAE1FX51_PETCI|nr:hypothetical protein Pcinc_014172 [Petrolisthes cinctipes]
MKWDVEYISWLPASAYITGVKMMVTESVWLHLMGIASGTLECGTCWSYLKKLCNSPYCIAGQTAVLVGVRTEVV